MGTSALRPRSASEIVDAAFQILRANYGQFVMCSALGYLPWLVLQLVFISDPAQFNESAGLVSLVSFIGGWMAFALMSVVIISCASNAYLGEPLDVAQAVRRAAPKLPRVLIAGILWALMLILGFICFLVGSLYVGARFFAINEVIILENAGIGRAFSRSSELSNGRKRHILNTLGLVTIIYLVLQVGLSIAAVLLANPVLQTVARAFAVILTYPIIAVTSVVLYYDTRIQSEGLDIQMMADDLAMGAPQRTAT